MAEPKYEINWDIDPDPDPAVGGLRVGVVSKERPTDPAQYSVLPWTKIGQLFINALALARLEGRQQRSNDPGEWLS